MTKIRRKELVIAGAAVIAALVLTLLLTIYIKRSTTPEFSFEVTHDDCVNLIPAGQAYTIEALGQIECTPHHYYYNLTAGGHLIEVDGTAFDTSRATILTPYNCFDYRTGANNQPTPETCYFVDDAGNRIAPTPILTKIMAHAPEIDHDFWSHIIEIDDEYFIEVELNVNLVSPGRLYYYDIANDQWTFLRSFDASIFANSNMVGFGK